MGDSVNDFLSRVQSRISGVPLKDAPTPRESSFGEGAMQGGAEGLLGNVLGVADIPLRGAMNAGQLARYGMGYKDSPFRKGGLLAPSGILPSGREAAAGVDTALGQLGGLFAASPEYDENLSRRNQVANEAPMGQAVGEIGADVATVGTGRAPLMKNKAGGILDESISKAIDAGVSVLGKKAKSTGMAKFTKDIMDSELFRDMARGLGRAGETGVEGMALAAIQGGDALDAAAMSAGTQMTSSLINTGVDEMFELIPEATGGAIKAPKTFKGKVGALAAYGGLMGGFMSLLQQFSPGDNSSLVADDSSYNKIAGMLMLGATVGLAGRRSVPDGVLSAFPKFADFVNSVPRTVVTSLIADLSKDETGLAQKTLETIQRSPDAFSGPQMDELLQGFENGDFVNRVEKLSADEKFRAILDAPDPRLAGVPVDDD